MYKKILVYRFDSLDLHLNCMNAFSCTQFDFRFNFSISYCNFGSDDTSYLKHGDKARGKRRHNRCLLRLISTK